MLHATHLEGAHDAPRDLPAGGGVDRVVAGGASGGPIETAEEPLDVGHVGRQGGRREVGQLAGVVGQTELGGDDRIGRRHPVDEALDEACHARRHRSPPGLAAAGLAPADRPDLWYESR